jgi:chemotaxis protein CheD
VLTGATARAWEAPAAAAQPGSQPTLHYLMPGHIIVSAEDSIISTVLGSCVSVCLFDPHRRAGGLNHYLLPHPVGREGHTARFAPVALAELVDQVLSLGCLRARLVARVYGGACVLPVGKCPEDHLGMRNVTAARDFLRKAAIPVLGEAIGGQRGRRLIFHTRTGEAVVRPL